VALPKMKWGGLHAHLSGESVIYTLH
jgi:hypothetical protein